LAAAGNIPDGIVIDSTHVKAHLSAAGAKKGAKPRRRSAAYMGNGPAKFTLWPTLKADRSPSS